MTRAGPEPPGGTGSGRHAMSVTVPRLERDRSWAGSCRMVDDGSGHGRGSASVQGLSNCNAKREEGPGVGGQGSPVHPTRDLAGLVGGRLAGAGPAFQVDGVTTSVAALLQDGGNISGRRAVARTLRLCRRGTGACLPRQDFRRLEAMSILAQR